MNMELINNELALFGLKNKLIIILKFYFLNISQSELLSFYRILQLLKQKYPDSNDVDFVENIRCNIRNNLQISTITSYIYNYNNDSLLKDLLNSIYIGIN